MSSKGNLMVVLTVEPIGEYGPDDHGVETPFELDAGDKLKGKTRTPRLTMTDATAERRVAELTYLAGKVGVTKVTGFEAFDAALAGDGFVNLHGVEVDCTM